MFDTWHFGQNLNCQIVVEACIVFAARNLEWLMEHDAYWQMSREELHGILQHECIESCGKQQLDAINKWYELKRDPDSTVNDFKELLQSANWKFITDDDVIDLMECLDDRQLR